MKKKYIVLIISILLFCITVSLWLDLFHQKQKSNYEKLNTEQVLCLDRMLSYTNIINTVMKKKNYTTEDIISFFEHNGNSYLKEVDTTNPVFRSMAKNPQIKIPEFDTIMKFKSRDIFFLFNDKKYTGYMFCDINPNRVGFY